MAPYFGGVLFGVSDGCVESHVADIAACTESILRLISATSVFDLYLCAQA